MRTSLPALGPCRFLAPPPSPWNDALRLRDAAERLSFTTGRDIDAAALGRVLRMPPRVMLAIACL